MTATGEATGQRGHWDGVYSDTPDFFGEDPSEVARTAGEAFRCAGVTHLLELGFGQGRDTFFFARQGVRVTGFDYSPHAVEIVRARSLELGLSDRVRVAEHDLRQPIPLPDGSVDACFAHMLLCMELSVAEISYILREIHRVLCPGGLVVYTVRSSHDKHYGMGSRLAADMYDVGGFVVHFFTEAKIRRLAEGFDELQVERVEEGSLPRDLFHVTMKKVDGFDFEAAAGPSQEGQMSEAMGKFQEFFDATYGAGVIDRKTKHLLALSASLAAGCDL